MTTVRKIVTSKIDGDSANNDGINEIRPYGEIAVYVGNNNKLELLMFDGVRTHLKSKVLNKGTFYGGDADSADGYGLDTIKLVPDAELYNNGNHQYLIVDPTAPNHIHLRPGGAIDQSNADLFLGGELNYVRVSDSYNTVSISTDTENGGAQSWVFNNYGVLTLPNGASLKDSGNESIAFGQEAGLTDQGEHAVAIGNSAGKATQGTRATAVGANAGQWSQSTDAVALGYLAGHNQQSSSAIAIGSGAASSNQGVNAIAIGGAAGASNQGWNSIAIGSFAGSNNQHHYSIILNATGMPLESDGQSRFYVNPIRNTSGGAFLNYNTTTKEVGYSEELTLANNSTINDTAVQTLFTSSFSMSVYAGNGGFNGYFAGDLNTHYAANPLIYTVTVGWFISGPGLNGVKEITSVLEETPETRVLTVDLTDGSIWSLTESPYTFYSPDYRVVPAATTLTVNSNEFKFIANGDLQLPNGALIKQNTSEVAAKQQAYNVAIGYWDNLKQFDLMLTAEAQGITVEGWPFLAWDLSGGNPQQYLTQLNEAWAVQNTPSSPPSPLIFNPPISAALKDQMRASLFMAVNAWDALQSSISTIDIVTGNTTTTIGDGKLTTPEIIQTTPEEDLVIRTRYAGVTSPPAGSGALSYANRDFVFGTNGTLTFPNGTVQSGAAIDLAYLKYILSNSATFDDFKNFITYL
jgi:hypothetical protein